MNRIPHRRAPYALFALAALALAGSASAADPRDNALDPVYFSGSQYTALLQPGLQRWTLSPQVGADVEIRSVAPCPHQVVPSRGLWLIGRDDAGRLELIAPSATLLPEGHSGRIALRACEEAIGSGDAPAYGVPAPVLELLAANSGAVLVDG